MSTSPTSIVADLLAIGWQTGFQIRESLKPIDAGELRRTVNGTLVNLTADEFRKYSLSIASDDMRPPALSQLWRGSTLTIAPVSELGDAIFTGGSSRTLVRPAYPGTIKCLTPDFRPVAHTVIGQTVSLSAPAAQTIRIYYRPVLEMMVTGWSTDESEATGESSWSIDLEEV